MKIGLLGFGVVGRGVYEITENRDDMQVTKVLCLEDIKLPDAQAVHNIRDKTCFQKEIQSSVSRQQKQLLSFSLFFYFSYKIEGKIFLDHAPAYDYCIYHSISHSILSPISSICF